MPRLKEQCWTYTCPELNDRPPLFVYKKEEGQGSYILTWKDERMSLTDAIESRFKRMCN